MNYNQKLYVVTRRDLPPGAQAVQGMHALVEFQVEFPDEARDWHRISNYLCFLAVENEQELNVLCGQLFNKRIKHALFREPDMNMALTAIAIEATNEAAEVVQPLRLALKNYAPMGQQSGQRSLKSRSSGQHRVGALKWIKRTLGIS